MFFDLDDLVSFFGSGFDFEIDDIFSESFDEDDEFEGFLNRIIIIEI